MKWINFLHCYQPANIDSFVIKEATEKSYRRIIGALERNPRVKFTLNISGCLVLRWKELGYFDLLKKVKKLVQKKQVELVGTAAYHPILPLIPEGETIKQIKENERILQEHFGGNAPLKLKGFFMPEMAYGTKTAKTIKKLGYKYLIMEELAFAGKLSDRSRREIYQDKNSGLKIIFRDRKLSRSYVPQTISKLLKKKNENQKTIITATDAELYGLRYIDHSGLFEKIIKEPNLEMLTVGEFIGNKKTKPVFLRASSWESTSAEIKNNNPYALWRNKKNKLQMKLWELADFAYQAMAKFKNDENRHWTRWHLVRGLASCTFWWASGRDFRHVFGPISWGPDEIERGADELIRSIRSIENKKSKKIKIEAEKLHAEIKRLIWEGHWNKYWKR